jgi:hypothetical protein
MSEPGYGTAPIFQVVCDPVTIRRWIDQITCNGVTCMALRRFSD